MSIKKIQKLTGFSYSTISRVLNGKAKEFRISANTCQAIQKAAKECNYRPNILARSLRLRKTMAIGLIVPDIRNPFFGELSWRIERLLREHGYSTIQCNTNEIPENEEFYLEVLVDRQVDGIIIAPIHTHKWDYLESIRKETSVVLLDRIFYETDLSCVTSDNTLAAEKLTSELIELGFTRIAYLGGTQDTYINTVRFQGYQNALKKHSLQLYENIVLFKGYSQEAGEQMMQTLLENDSDIEVVFCINNLVFLGAMKIVQIHESMTSRKIMMAAFDIGRYCHIFKRPLVCANQDLQKLANATVSLLIDNIRDKPLKDNQIIVPISVHKHRID